VTRKEKALWSAVCAVLAQHRYRRRQDLG